jgi:hypothetical protein
MMIALPAIPISDRRLSAAPGGYRQRPAMIVSVNDMCYMSRQRLHLAPSQGNP